MDDEKHCNPEDKMVDEYARITDDVVKWVKKITGGAKIKKSNCDDI